MKPLDFKYDQGADVMTIEGIHYSGDLFRSMATEGLGECAFKIISRIDGVVVLQKVEVPL